MGVIFGVPTHVHIGKHMQVGHISEHAQFKVYFSEQGGFKVIEHTFKKERWQTNF